MSNSAINTEIQWCVCQRCEEAFFVKKDEENVRCPRCGTTDQESLVFEAEQEDEHA